MCAVDDVSVRGFGMSMLDGRMRWEGEEGEGRGEEKEVEGPSDCPRYQKGAVNVDVEYATPGIDVVFNR